MSFLSNIAEQAKNALMTQIPIAIETNKPKIIEALKAYIAKNPQNGDIIKKNLADISAGIQTAGSRRRRTIKRKVGGKKTRKH